MDKIRHRKGKNKNFYMIDNSIHKLGLKPMEFMVYCTLMKYANKAGEAFPGYTTIARDCGASRPSVINAVKGLCKIGIIEIEKRSNKSNLYTVYDADDIYYAKKESYPHADSEDMDPEELKVLLFEARKKLEG